MTNSAPALDADRGDQSGSAAFLGLCASVLAAFVLLFGLVVTSGWPWEAIHPAINAMLNASSTVFLVAGWVAVKRGNVGLHWRSMVAAFTASSVFLASYLARYAMSGTHRYAGEGLGKIAYLIILFSHMALAALAVPFILRLLWLARKRRFDDHKKLARWVWPVWVYVSATGVVVYFMLYWVGSSS